MAAAELQELLARRKRTVDADGLHYESAPRNSTADVQHSDETPSKAKEKLLGAPSPTVTPKAAKQIFDRVDCELSPGGADSVKKTGNDAAQRLAQPAESASEDARAPPAPAAAEAAPAETLPEALAVSPTSPAVEEAAEGCPL